MSLEEQVSSLQSLSGDEIHSFILSVQRELLKQPQVEMPLLHHFSEGVYGRELQIPKGTLLVGKVHKFETLNILLKGDMTVASIDGVKRIQAPYIYTSAPGAKKMAYAHEDSVWLNVLPTSETDPSIIEKIFTEDEVEIEAEQEDPCLSQ